MKPFLNRAWKKVINPGNVDFEGMKSMNEKELEEYVRGIYMGEYAKAWIQWTYLFHWMCNNNGWQYILARVVLS